MGATAAGGLAGRRAVVTGAGGALGESIAARLADAGARVGALYRTDPGGIPGRGARRRGRPGG